MGQVESPFGFTDWPGSEQGQRAAEPPEKPLAPHWRAPCLDNSDLSFGFQCDWKPPKVQQRGVEATRGIIVRMLEGLDCPEKQKILVVDMLPNRRGV